MQSISVLGGWQGFVVDHIEPSDPGEGRDVVQVFLRPRRNFLPRCRDCGQKVSRVHDWGVRPVRDLPVWGTRTLLHIHFRRVRCPQCGPRPEQIGWLSRYARVTNRLADQIARLCELLPIKHVAQQYGVGWGTVKRIHKSRLREVLDPPDLSGVRVIGMDEFSIQKGHRYATVITDMETKRVLWVGRGRGRDDIRPFFELLGNEGRAAIQAVAMDMNGAYEKEVRFQCPQAKIIYDLFHVLAKYAREVVDKVRSSEAHRLRHSLEDRKVIKSSRWLLLRNRRNLTRNEDRVRLRELLAANRRICTVYLLNEDLKHLWSYRYPAAALKFWNQWYRRAMYSQIDPLKRFARRLRPYLDGILAHCKWRIGTSLIEGINNKIKVIKRMAYGFRDDDYFFLRIRHAFPGNR